MMRRLHDAGFHVLADKPWIAVDVKAVIPLALWILLKIIKKNKYDQNVLGRLNRIHGADRPGDDRLEARIRSYELAARMQQVAPDTLDLSRESERTVVRTR